MLSQDEINKFSAFVRDNFSEKSNELVDALDYVNMILDDIYDCTTGKINECLINRDTRSSHEIIEYLDVISNLKNTVDKYLALFVVEEEIEEEIEETDEDIPDYSAYVIDTTIPHTLYEDFTHKKACGFEFKGRHYPAKNMRDVMVSLCNILAKENKEKMIGFINDPNMEGRKVKYFSNKLVVENGVNKNEKIENLNVYIWVNLSCNQIKNVIKKVLKKYNYKLDDFKIFLRADYTDLHKK